MADKIGDPDRIINSMFNSVWVSRVDRGIISFIKYLNTTNEEYVDYFILSWKVSE